MFIVPKWAALPLLAFICLGTATIADGQKPVNDLATTGDVPSWYGIIVCMKKTFHVDERLLRDARLACGASTDTETIRLGLEALVRHAAYERLRALRGSEPKAQDVPRRRERPLAAKTRRHSAA